MLVANVSMVVLRKGAGYLGCGMWGCVGVVGVCTPLQRFHNMLTWKTMLHLHVLMWFHMVLKWCWCRKMVMCQWVTRHQCDRVMTWKISHVNIVNVAKFWHGANVTNWPFDGWRLDATITHCWCGWQSTSFKK